MQRLPAISFFPVLFVAKGSNLLPVAETKASVTKAETAKV